MLGSARADVAHPAHAGHAEPGSCRSSGTGAYTTACLQDTPHHAVVLLGTQSLTLCSDAAAEGSKLKYKQGQQRLTARSMSTARESPMPLMLGVL